MCTDFPAFVDSNVEVWYRQLTSPLNALRIVLTIALEREAAAACLGEDAEAAVSFWPSSLYGILAAQAAGSTLFWDRCSQHVEESLGETMRQFQALSPSALSRLFREGCQLLNNRELASLLWVLLKRHESVSNLMAGRLGAELEVVAVRRPMRLADVAKETESSNDAIEPHVVKSLISRDCTAGIQSENATFPQRH